MVYFRCTNEEGQLGGPIEDMGTAGVVRGETRTIEETMMIWTMLMKMSRLGIIGGERIKNLLVII